MDIALRAAAADIKHKEAKKNEEDARNDLAKIIAKMEPAKIQASYDQDAKSWQSTTIAPDPIAALFDGIQFRGSIVGKAEDVKGGAISRIRQYVEEAKKQAIASVIDDVNHQRDMWIRRCGEKDHQIERLERAIHQISGNRASEVINACRETFGSSDKGIAMGIAERRQ